MVEVNGEQERVPKLHGLNSHVKYGLNRTWKLKFRHQVLFNSHGKQAYSRFPSSLNPFMDS